MGQRYVYLLRLPISADRDVMLHLDHHEESQDRRTLTRPSRRLRLVRYDSILDCWSTGLCW